MFVYRDLVIQGSKVQIEQFLQNTLNFSHKDWKIACVEDDDTKILKLKYCGRKYKPAVLTVILDENNANNKYFVHIISEFGATLSMEEYNNLLLTAKLIVLNKTGKGLVKLVLTNGKKDIKDVVGLTAAKAFTKFYSIAGNETTYFDLNDRIRWFEFISCLANSRKQFQENDLARIFNEDFAYSLELAEHLAHTAYFGMQLLKYKKNCEETKI